ncbi:hypothetical protein WDU94_013492 [Cyamophila willieti]
MPFFLKVPAKSRSRRSAMDNSDNEKGTKSKLIKLQQLIFLNNRQKDEIKKRRRRNLRKDSVPTNETGKPNKWQIPIFVIGSEGKESEENYSADKKHNEKRLSSALKSNPFWRDNTFVKAETEFDMESAKAMNANKKAEAEKKKRLTKNNDSSTKPPNKYISDQITESSGQVKINRSKTPMSQLNYPDNILKHMATDEMYDKNKTEFREKRKMFVLNKKFENPNSFAPFAPAANNVASRNTNDHLEDEKGLIDRINTYTYAQIGQQSPVKMITDFNKIAKTPDKSAKSPIFTKAVENNFPSTMKTNFKPKFTPVKRSDQYKDGGNIPFDENEEIKMVERINKYTEQNNQMPLKPKPNFHNVNYTSTRRKFSLFASPEENLFLKKDSTKQDTRQSIPVSEKSEEEVQFVTRKPPEKTPIQRHIVHQDQQKTYRDKTGKVISGTLKQPERSKQKQNEPSTEKSADMEKKASSIKLKEKVGHIKPKNNMNDIHKIRTDTEIALKNFESKHHIDEKNQNDLTKPKNKVENIKESKQSYQSSSEETQFSTEIKRREPEPVSPDERKNFRKYSKKRVKEVVIKSATEEPIIKTTIKITDDSTKYPRISKTIPKKFKPMPPKNNEKEIITNHVKYERKVKKHNTGNDLSIFDDMDISTSSESIESQESKVHHDIDKATSPSTRTYKITRSKNSDKYHRDLFASGSKDNVIQNTKPENQTLSNLETNEQPRYFKKVQEIQETASEDSPKTTYYEEIDYRTTMNPNFAKHAKEIRDSVGIPNVNYYDDKMIVTESIPISSNDGKGIYDKIFGKNENNISEDKKNPLFHTNSNTHADQYEHQVQKPEDLITNSNENQRENDNYHNQDHIYHPEDTRNKTIEDLRDNINTFYDMNYDDPNGDGYYRHNNSHIDNGHADIANHTFEDNYNYHLTTTEPASYNDNGQYDSREKTTTSYQASEDNYDHHLTTTRPASYDDNGQYDSREKTTTSYQASEDNYDHHLTTTRPASYDDNGQYDYHGKTTTSYPHYELAEEFESRNNEQDNIKNHNFDRPTAVFPNKEDQYYTNDEHNEDIKPYNNDYEEATIGDHHHPHPVINDSIEHQNPDVSSYSSNPYLNGQLMQQNPDTHGEFPLEQQDMLEGEGPQVNFYEEDKKYLSESKKIKETPDSESRTEEEYDQSGGQEDYDTEYPTTTPTASSDTSAPIDMKAAGQELNENHKHGGTHGDDHTGNKNEHHKKGQGEKHEKTKKKSKGKNNKESYDNYHEEESAKKGHNKKEKHKKKYHDTKGEKRKHSEEQGHYGKSEEEEEAEKGAKFEEEGSHEKGHSTKGEHNIHKVNEYMKKHEFYDEHHDGGEHEKHGGFQEHHDHSKGKKEKSGKQSGKHTSGEQGKKGMADHGKKYEDYKKVGKQEGVKKHHAENKEWEEQGSKKTEKKRGHEN